ncbi:MAG TPA: immunoglobulin domain-containing protein, partial [Candidatus Binatia bacterium]|nr:immunoglobulin domain-containing protein [Candidatus Binatia bacterium]
MKTWFRPMRNIRFAALAILSCAWCAASTPTTAAGVAPTITNQPYGGYVVVGSNFTFSAGATGTAPLNYQWFFNNTNRITGATNATLTLGPLGSSGTGDYKLIVTNASGSATSTVATLTVVPYAPSPVIVNQTYSANNMFFAFATVAFAHYEIQATTLVCGGAWTVVGHIVGDGGIASYTIPAFGGAGFFRVLALGSSHYSANVVGYRHIPLAANYNLISDPFKFTSANRVYEVLPDLPAICSDFACPTLVKPGPGNPQWECAFFCDCLDGRGWYDCDMTQLRPPMTLRPGEGAIFYAETP